MVLEGKCSILCFWFAVRSCTDPNKAPALHACHSASVSQALVDSHIGLHPIFCHSLLPALKSVKVVESSDEDRDSTAPQDVDQEDEQYSDASSNGKDYPQLGS